MTSCASKTCPLAPGSWGFKGPLVSLLSPVVCRHVCLRFLGRLADLLFVARLGHLAAAWVAFVKQLRQEVAISVFVEDQFTLGRCGVGLCVLDFEEGGSRTVRAAGVHDPQVGVVEHVDDVLTWWKFGVSCMELEWDVDFKVANNLRMRSGCVNR